MDKNYFNLNEQAILFCNLNKMPQWWKQVLADKELYVNIRKNDRVNVYYHGYSVMKLTYKNRGNKGFNAKIHYKYLPDAGPNQNGYIYVNPEIIISNIRDVKKRIDNNKKSDYPEGDCEKVIQGKMYISGNYIDTEFEFVRERLSRTITRIDFTTIHENGMLEFVELKRISDPRLLTSDTSQRKEKIRTQMGYYKRFIIENHDEIIEYYKKLQRVLIFIGVNNPLTSIPITGVSDEVRLIFAGYNDGKANHPQRRNRIAKIKKILQEENIKSNIEEI